MRTAFALLLCLTFLPANSPAFAQEPDATVDNVDGAAETGGTTSPLLDSPLLRQPETTLDLFQAARLMTDLARYRLAKRYLELLLESNPDAAELLELRDRFGPAELLKLSRVVELRPASSDLLKKVNGAFGSARDDTQRIDALVARLTAAPREREVALSTLRDTGVTAIPRLLAALGNPQNQEDHNLLVYSLAKLGRDAVPPLLAALDSPNAEIRLSVAEALGWIGSRDAIPHLLYPAYSSIENEKVRLTSLAAIRRIAKSESIVQGSLGAAAALRRQAVAHLAGNPDLEPGSDGTIDVWVWDSDANTIAPVVVDSTTASLFAGTRFAAKAARLSPENAESQAVLLALSLGREAHAVGWSKPIVTGPGTAHDLALSSGETAVLRALQIALESHNSDSARGALQVLGELGSPVNADNSSLYSAMNYPNARIQFAAANAIMNRGKVEVDNRLIEVFSRVLNGAGQAHGVIIDPTTTRSQLTASQLDGFGFKALVAHTGRKGFRLAAESANVAIVMVNANCTDWVLSETIVNLRADQRTASIPIVILGAASSQTKLEAMAARHQAMTFLDEDLITDTLGRQLRPFVERFNPALSQRERSEQRTLAAFWLAHLAETNAPARAALGAAESALANAADDPRLVSDALSALSRVPTTTAQTRLLEILLSTTRTAETRELAAVQLAAHIQLYGLLLDESQREELQQVSNGDVAPQLATALATIHGVMRPNRAEIQNQVESFGLPAKP